MIHSRVTVADWNADGLADMLIGGSKGQVLFYPNWGTKMEPRFSYAQLVMTADGKPLDVGWGAAPLAVDWDGDGLLDLLCGCERNRILFYHNAGRPGAPQLVNRGFVTAEGGPIALPIRPVPKSPEGIYTHDYYPVLEAVDWNGDGKTDLLAGGAVTGRIFLFQNTGVADDGTPILASHGLLEADGKVLNVVDWCAAPCAADFDGDGDLDLISGNMPLTDGGGDSSDAEHFLRYYENVGNCTAPELVERDFPRTGKFPNAVLGTPRAVDFDDDGVLDLVVSAGENVFLYRNAGTRSAPRFAVHAKALACPWGSVPLPTFGLQFRDWDGDRLPDMLSGLTIYRNLGNGEYAAEPLLAGGDKIDHPAPRGESGSSRRFPTSNNGDGQFQIWHGTHEGTSGCIPTAAARLRGSTRPASVCLWKMVSRCTSARSLARRWISMSCKARARRLRQPISTPTAWQIWSLATRMARLDLTCFEDAAARDSPCLRTWAISRSGWSPTQLTGTATANPSVIGSAAGGTVVVWRNLEGSHAEPGTPQGHTVPLRADGGRGRLEPGRRPGPDRRHRLRLLLLVRALVPRQGLRPSAKAVLIPARAQFARHRPTGHASARHSAIELTVRPNDG